MGCDTSKQTPPRAKHAPSSTRAPPVADYCRSGTTAATLVLRFSANTKHLAHIVAATIDLSTPCERKCLDDILYEQQAEGAVVQALRRSGEVQVRISDEKVLRAFLESSMCKEQDNSSREDDDDDNDDDRSVKFCAIRNNEKVEIIEEPHAPYLKDARDA